MRRLAWVLVLLTAGSTLLTAGCTKSSAPEAASIQSIGGPGSEQGRFATPRATAWDPRGFLYVVDKTGRIQKFDAAGRYLLGWSTPESEKGRPTGVTIDEKGDVWIADTHYHRVLHYSPDGALLSEFGREGSAPGQFLYPTGIAFGPDGLIYVSEYGGNDRIQALTRDGKPVRAWGSYGADSGQFQRPQGIAIAGDRLYVADAANHRIQVFSLDGKLLFSWGDLKYPYSVSLDAEGNLLVAEYGRHRVSKFSPDGKALASAGKPGSGPADLNTPWSAIPIGGDRIAVVDSGNHRVQLWPVSLLRAPVSFGQPWFLLLLLVLPLILVFSRWSRAGLEPGRSIAGTIVRSLLVAALVLALADAQWVSKSYRTSTLFLLDHSFSIPPDVQRKAFTWINDQLKKLPQDDSAGVIVFGEDAMIEVPPVEKPELSGPTSLVGRTATDLGAAIRLALAVFPPSYQKRIVVVSDGNENRGHAVAEAELARAQGVVIDVLALKYDYPGEVWMESLLVPAELIPKEPFDVTAVINSQQAGPAKLSIFRNGDLLSHQTVTLNKGKNVFTVKQRVEDAGSYAYEAVVEMAGDTVSSNNSAQGFAHAQGEARIALVGGDATDTGALATALRDEGLKVSVFQPEQFQGGRVEVADFDCVVIANVEAIRLGQAAMQALEAAVHDAGVGFIMIGGEHGYGPGGYRGSPIEELLPVTMEQPQRRVIPNGALCLVLHTCEIAEGNYWAKQIGKAALNVLGPRDYMGVVLYGQQTEEWLFPMQLVQDRGKLHALLDNCQPWDMPSFELAYQLAHQGLKQVNAASKHMVVISDADPAGPTDATVDAIVKDRITVSTVAIGPHGSSDIARMQKTALRAGGRFYEVTDPSKLPQIFIKEASTIQRSMIVEGDIPPVVLGTSEALKGIPQDALPLLHGYTITHAKPLSKTSIGALVPKDQSGNETQFDGLMIEWTYGLGRTIAFTSDAKARWGRNWTAWENYRKFWSQAVRSVLRTVPRSPYAVQTRIDGGKGKVTIDAIDDQGKFIHTLQFLGSVTSPAGKKQGLSFRQVGPGRYEAEFEAGAVGVYTVTGTFEGAHGEKGYLSQGVPLSYAAEYRDLKFNLSLLSQIHERTGGRRLALDTPVYAPLNRSAGVSMPLWPYLLMVLLALFPVDIFIRRVAVDWPAVGRRIAGSFRRSPKAVKEAEVPASIRQLARAKQEARAETLAPSQVEGLPTVQGTVDLGDAAGPAKPEAAPPAAKPPPARPAEPKPEAKPEQAGYLNRLLDAKKKSQQKPKD